MTHGATESGRTRDRILAAAESLLDEHGPSGVTMRSVADRVGVSTMASYRHFSDRDALLSAMVDRGFDELASRFSPEPGASVDEALMAMLDAFVDHALDRPHLFFLMFTARRAGARDLASQAADSPTLRVVVTTLRRGVEERLYRDTGLTEVAVSVAALIQGLCQMRYADRLGGSDEEFRGLCRRSVERVLDGIRR